MISSEWIYYVVSTFMIIGIWRLFKRSNVFVDNSWFFRYAFLLSVLYFYYHLNFVWSGRTEDAQREYLFYIADTVIYSEYHSTIFKTGLFMTIIFRNCIETSELKGFIQFFAYSEMIYSLYELLSNFNDNIKGFIVIQTLFLFGLMNQKCLQKDILPGLIKLLFISFVMANIFQYYTYDQFLATILNTAIPFVLKGVSCIVYLSFHCYQHEQNRQWIDNYIGWWNIDENKNLYYHFKKNPKLSTSKLMIMLGTWIFITIGYWAVISLLLNEVNWIILFFIYLSLSHICAEFMGLYSGEYSINAKLLNGASIFLVLIVFF